MANLKISQLNSYTGGSGDLRWFIMNNSGETATFKFSGYTSPLRTANGTNSAVSINLPTSYAPGISALVWGTHNAASSGDYSVVMGGQNNRTDSNYGFVGGGQTNLAGFRSVVLGGNNNTANGNAAAVIGSESCGVNNGSYAIAIGSLSSNYFGGNDVANAIYSGYENRFSINGVHASVMLGGYQNRWHHFDLNNFDTRRAYGAMIGGRNNRIEGDTTDSSGSHAYPLIFGGRENKIFGVYTTSGETSGSTIINSISSTIFKSTLSAHIQAFNGTISGRTRAVMIGTSGRTADADNTTFVESLHVFRTPSTAVQAQVTGTTFTVDLNLGAKAQLYMTGASTVDFTNVRDGQSFVLKTITDGGHSITWTATGYTFKWKGGSSSPGNNKTDLWRFEVFGTEIFGELVSDFS